MLSLLQAPCAPYSPNRLVLRLLRPSGPQPGGRLAMEGDGMMVDVVQTARLLALAVVTLGGLGLLIVGGSTVLELIAAR